MKRNTQLWQMLVITLILVCMSLNIIPATQSFPIKEEQSHEIGCWCELEGFNGMMGENGWYIGPIQFWINNSMNHSYFKIDNGAWVEYLTPITLIGDGYHTLWWYCLDEWGNQSPIFNVSYKMDMTPPDVHVSVHRDGCRIGVSVDAVDNTSGVVLVEFYSDYTLIGNCTIEPYEMSWIVSPFDNHTVEVIVYDAAGLDANASQTVPYELNLIQSSFYQQFLRASKNLLLFPHLFKVTEVQ